MFRTKNVFFITMFLTALLLCLESCKTLPLRVPEEKNSRVYGDTKGLFRHRWWNYYERALSFENGGFWKEAESDLKEAVRQRKNDKRRTRTYGMHFIDYFPHRELGIIHYRQGNLEAAISELTASLSMAKSAKAEFYLDRARKTLIEKKQLDRHPPEINIKSPGQSFSTNAFSVLIEGIAEDDTFVRYITVANKKVRVDVSNSRLPFHMEVPLVPGKNVIPVTVTDLVGKISQASVIVEANRITPVLSKSEPFDNEMVLYGRLRKSEDSLNIPLVLVPMLRVGMQGAALRADIPRRNLPGKSLSLNLWIRLFPTLILLIRKEMFLIIQA
ncbi:MAG: hypothetical protein GY749_37125 [Desulfobacteraceae bacterium]|nr:hypothetical protein [Desulfobacteraceae bacterium]